MFSNEHFIALISGFLAWWLTGFYDDFIILMRILKRNDKPNDRIKIFVGQLVGVAFLLSISFTITSFLTPNIWTERVSGLILILIGIWFLVSENGDEDKNRKPKGNHLFVVAFLLYVFNSLDDFSLTSASLLSMETHLKFLFCGGFLLGWSSSFFMALKTMKVKKFSWLEKFGPWIIIAGGLLLIVSTLT